MITDNMKTATGLTPAELEAVKSARYVLLIYEPYKKTGVHGFLARNRFFTYLRKLGFSQFTGRGYVYLGVFAPHEVERIATAVQVYAERNKITGDITLLDLDGPSFTRTRRLYTFIASPEETVQKSEVL